MPVRSTDVSSPVLTSKKSILLVPLEYVEGGVLSVAVLSKDLPVRMLSLVCLMIHHGWCILWVSLSEIARDSRTQECPIELH